MTLYLNFMVKHQNYVDSWRVNTFDAAQKAILSTCESFEEFEASGISNSNFLSEFVENNFEVVDYGCGIGRVAKFLSSKVRLLHGIDISPEMLEYARQYCKDCKNIKFTLTDSTKIPLKDSSIDFAYSLLTLQHLEKEDALLVLKELYRVLKDNSKIFLTFPDLASEHNWHTFEKFATNTNTRVPHRMRMYTISEVEIVIERLGFKLISFSKNRVQKNDQNIEVLAMKKCGF